MLLILVAKYYKATYSRGRKRTLSMVRKIAVPQLMLAVLGSLHAQAQQAPYGPERT